MPRLSPTASPSYRLHKQSGQAIVTLSGRDILLGKFKSAASHRKYHRVVNEWRASGGIAPKPREARSFENEMTVKELIVAFWRYAEEFYGKGSSPLERYHQVLRRLKHLYGEARAIDFGPLALKVVRDSMTRPLVVIDPKTKEPKTLGDWCRTSINQQVRRIRNVFRWAVENEMLPASVHHGLLAVSGLRAGRAGNVREGRPVKPVPDAHVDAVLPHLSNQLQAMIRLQLLTAMRPGEVCIMRAKDIDTTGKLWIYTPEHHKTEHLGAERKIYLGPQAQRIIRPFLRRELAAYLFSPAEAEAERRRAAHEARKTPMSCGNRPGQGIAPQPKRSPGQVYDVAAYRRAITRACTAAEVPEWHPHQLRHNAATRIRKQHNLEAAQHVLGHRSASVTEIYAERDAGAAMKVMQEMG